MVNKGLIWIQKIGSRQTKDSTFKTIANPGKTKAQEFTRPAICDGCSNNINKNTDFENTNGLKNFTLHI